jgi:hypothetical protein
VAALVMVVAAGAFALPDLPRSDTAAAASPAVDLRIRIAASARSGASTRTWRLRCKPAGGDWPSVGPACRRLKPALLAAFEIETKDYTRITRQPVRITGRAFGKVVSLRFPAMGSGTRAARLKALRTALGPNAFSTAERRSR